MGEQLGMAFVQPGLKQGSGLGQASEAPSVVVPGLYYIPGFLNEDEQAALHKEIDNSPWLDDLDRRVQHYGWKYDYRMRTVSRDMYLGPLPPWLQKIAKRLFEDVGRFDRVPDQAIVNEYLPGQGIASHADRDCFGPAVATISLLEAWRMDFRRIGERDRAKSMLLEKGSLLVMVGESRYGWKHGIGKRKREWIGGNWQWRCRRVSVTFRTVLDKTVGTAANFLGKQSE